jgi:hypothetical protein
VDSGPVRKKVARDSPQTGDKSSGRSSSSPAEPRQDPEAAAAPRDKARQVDDDESAAVATAARAKANDFLQQEANQKIGGRTGGVYIPPFKLAAMQKEMAKMDKVRSGRQSD